MSKKFEFRRFDIVEFGAGIYSGDGPLVTAQDALDREAVNADRIRVLELQLKEAKELLTGASHALRSYQYGNSATDLAKDLADKIDAALVVK